MRNEADVWNRFAGFYDSFMKRDMPAYDIIIQKVSALLAPDSNVLEVATGTGIISLGIAKNVGRIEAIDIAEDMIAKAKAKAKAQITDIANLCFSIHSAYSLPYAENTFDAVIIANTLHIMPRPEDALLEIKRVLKPNGRLIAPTFIHAGSRKAAVMSRLASFTGFRAYHRWTQQSYCRFLENNGWRVTNTELLPASFPLVYCLCKPVEGGLYA